VPPTRSRRRRLLLAGIASLLGFGLAIGLVEAALRTFDPIGLRYEAEFTNYRTQAVQFAWERQPPPAPAEFLDGHLYRHKPGLDLPLGSFRLRTNSLGCRSPEIARDKPAGMRYQVFKQADGVSFVHVSAFDDADAKEVRPHTVGDAGGEIRILGRGQPFD